METPTEPKSRRARRNPTWVGATTEEMEPETQAAQPNTVYDTLHGLVQQYHEIDLKIAACADLPPSPQKPLFWESGEQMIVYRQQAMQWYDEFEKAEWQQAPLYEERGKLIGNIKDLLRHHPEDTFRFTVREQTYVGWVRKRKYDYTVEHIAEFVKWEEYCNEFHINPQTGRYLEEEAEEQLGAALKAAREAASTTEPDPLPELPIAAKWASQAMSTAREVIRRQFMDLDPDDTKVIRVAQLILLAAQPQS